MPRKTTVYPEIIRDMTEKKSEKKITIWLEAKQTMHFKQQVQITQEEYDKLKKFDLDDVDERNNHAEYSMIEGLIDFRDVLDSNREFKDVRIIKKSI